MKMWGSSHTGLAIGTAKTRFIIESITDRDNCVLVATCIGWKCTLVLHCISQLIALAIATVTVMLQK